MVTGALCYEWIGALTFLSPYLIFIMLTITYCRMRINDLRFGRMQYVLLATQLLMSALAYFLFLPFGDIVASGVFVCVFIPTATSAPVVTQMLGGSISKVASYSLLVNMVIAVAAPVILAIIGSHNEMTVISAFFTIGKKVFPLLIMPIVVAMLLRRFTPKLHRQIANHQMMSFYIWAVALFIVMGGSVSFVIKHYNDRSPAILIYLAVGALVVCCAQFITGRKIGHKFGEPVTCCQSLGQKNTLLAIWMALTFLNPLASVAPACYVCWQNIINSWQVARHDARESKRKEQEKGDH